MQPYDKIEKNCRYGEYDLSKKAAYTITNDKELFEPWYYILQNRKILLYVDQNGPVKIQYQPPSGILVAKRELGEKQSKLQTWIQCDLVNGGIPFSNQLHAIPLFYHPGCFYSAMQYFLPPCFTRFIC